MPRLWPDGWTGTSDAPLGTAPEDTTGNGPAFNNVTHKITNLPYDQLYNRIAPGKRDTSLDRDEGLELESPGVPRRWCRLTSVTTRGTTPYGV
jgi:hypothetical protein